MKTAIKKNLWWIISSIVLFVPIALAIYDMQCNFSDKLSMGTTFFIALFLILAATGIIANKIKKIVFKVLWIILGFTTYAIGWIFTIFIIAFSAPITEEEIISRKEDFRDMIYREFDEADYLDNIVGIQLPQYRIVDSECTYVTFPPTETEYNVNLKIHFPEGLPDSVWKEISKNASNKASNPLSDCEVINEWGVCEDNPEARIYKCENSRNKGCAVTFESNSDTAYVTCYKW
jgi:energy-coupling factor transporter transmembrane protein EcfT